MDYNPLGEVGVKIVARAFPGSGYRLGSCIVWPGQDDTVWLGNPKVDAAVIARALPVQEEEVALGSDVAKIHVMNGRLEALHLDEQVQVSVPLATNYVWSLGCHALPHVYRKDDLRMLMLAARRATAMVSSKSLQAQYSTTMYNPRMGGMAHIQVGLLLPPVCLWPIC